MEDSVIWETFYRLLDLMLSENNISFPILALLGKH